MKIIDRNIAEQIRGIFRKEGGGSEWRDIPTEKGSKQVLSDTEILELSALVVKIETHYGFPCDIEWAREGGKFYIVQSRPITTLTTTTTTTETKTKETVLVKMFTREHSLFYAYVWKSANCERNIDWLGMNFEKVAYLRPGEKGVLEVWYAQSEFDEFEVAIVERYRADANWFKKVSDAFETHWLYLLPYFQQVTPLTIEEAKDFYAHWIEWWTPMAIVMQIPEIRSLPEDVRVHALELRTSSQEYSDKGDEVYYRFAEALYPQVKNYVSVLTPEEVFSGRLPEEVELQARSRGWYMFNDSDGRISELESSVREKGFIFESVTLEDGEIKGSTAHPGCVQGRVVIVRSVEELNKVDEQAILVTPMTDPRYVPVLSRVAAIVTDEGGITCHAAIVARELKKPCIIGTKTATQVLKDGDLVEVDANKGIVRIIRQSEGAGARLREQTLPDGPEHKETVLGKIKITDWQKDWDGRFSILNIFATTAYGRPMIERFGLGIDNVFIIHRDGLSSAYYSKKSNDAFGRHLATLVSTHKGTIQQWSEALITSSANVESMFEQPVEQFLTSNSIEHFLDEFTEFAMYQQVNKTIANYLSEEQTHQYVAILEDARRKTEHTFPKLNAYYEIIGQYFHTLHGLAPELGTALTVPELVIYAHTNTLPDEDTLRQRYHGSGWYFGASVVEFTDAEVLAIEASWHKKLSDACVGTSAFPGKVTGRVRVILNYKKDADSFKVGEILVTGMTDPHFVPVMEKAAGIVTDAGGVLCHAAIVARELKTPCVIGTTYATSTFQTGDLVEVDADSGVVRVLERSMSI